MSGLIPLFNSYCINQSVDSEMICGTRRNGELIKHRLLFAGIALKNILPGLLDDLSIYHPEGYLGELARVLSRNKSAVHKLSNKARFYYNTYHDFREQVKRLEQEIRNKHATGH